ncbi:hypothetical protein BJ508DRAFT_366757 [Ascobolus immersus RN42]|uniref:Uncharacterized protein n=1 Tax=Ascobolus immersus RN42 TaxID=1160509 RepID=A0A3N4HKE2_ASCIM|nr:hypothetical protein BJ508DRAFT_366757 [Ascobolus immersus RN42]
MAFIAQVFPCFFCREGTVNSDIFTKPDPKAYKTQGGLERHVKNIHGGGERRIRVAFRYADFLESCDRAGLIFDRYLDVCLSMKMGSKVNPAKRAEDWNPRIRLLAEREFMFAVYNKAMDRAADELDLRVEWSPNDALIAAVEKHEEQWRAATRRDNPRKILVFREFPVEPSYIMKEAGVVEARNETPTNPPPAEAGTATESTGRPQADVKVEIKAEDDQGHGNRTSRTPSAPSEIGLPRELSSDANYAGSDDRGSEEPGLSRSESHPPQSSNAVDNRVPSMSLIPSQHTSRQGTSMDVDSDAVAPTETPQATRQATIEAPAEPTTKTDASTQTEGDIIVFGTSQGNGYLIEVSDDFDVAGLLAHMHARKRRRVGY